MCGMVLPLIFAFSLSFWGKISKFLLSFPAVCSSVTLSREEHLVLLARFIEEEGWGWMYVAAAAENELLCQEAACLISGFV